ncbi:MAG: outer membrane usher protein [Leclercia sp.]
MNFRRSFLYLSVYAALSAYTYANDNLPVNNNEQDEVEFNDQFLFNTGSKIDVSRYSQGNPIMPGEYRAKIIVNGKSKLTATVSFKENGTLWASPCLSRSMLNQLDIDTAKINDTQADEDACINMAEQYPGSSVEFNTSTQALELSIPQIYIVKRPAGYVDASLWDEGITAGLISYDLNAWHSQNSYSSQDTAYTGVRYGLNYGAWRFRSRGNLNWDSNSGTQYTHQDIFLQRDITALKAQMLIGDSYTRGDAFDSVSLRGVRMYNDDRMLSNGLSTYAPTIRGVANSNAKVTITQSGNTIHETTVPPGAFEINDLNTTGYGNDLHVTIEESDGSQHAFSVPYSSVAQMLRPGFARWDIGVGRLNDDSLHDAPNLAYGAVYYGLNNTFTGYTGIQYLDVGFSAVLAGLAMNTSLGAFAFDVTHSNASLEDLQTLKGESYRLSWSKMLSATNTAFNVAGYRFSTKDYLSLHDAASLAEQVKYQSQGADTQASYNDFQRMKNQFQINISQPLKNGETDLGSMYINGSWQNYWNSTSTTSSYSMGYSNSFRYGSYSVALQRTYNDYGAQDDSLYLSINLPFDALSGKDSRPAGFSNINVGMNSDFKGSNTLNMTANGNTDDSRLSYSVTTTYNQSPDRDISRISSYGGYNSSYGPLSLSASSSSDSSKQYSASYSGGMLLHSGGLTLTPGSIGETDALALVKASGAEGAFLTNGSGEINGSGYAVMPYLSAYRENRITLDTSNLTADVDVKNNSTLAIPRNGAVILVDFETDQRRSAVIELMRSDKGFIPLGADVFNEKGENIGTVGQAGQAWVRGIGNNGTLRVVWGSGKENTCTASYRMDSGAQKVGLTTMLSNQLCHL